jgi:glycosyltransferase involved in cell wall biosynthesis
VTVAAPTPAVSLITTCKGRLAFLKQSLPRMVAQTGTEVVLVDFDCPEDSGAWAEREFPAVRVVRVASAPHYHGTRARNLGAQAASAPWLCFVDADVLLEDQFAERVLPMLREGAYYITSGAEAELIGTTACLRDDYVAIEGYDEVIEGWGVDDTDFYIRLQLLGRRREVFPAGLFRVMSHDTETRMRFHAIKDQWLTHRTNALYAQVRHDLARQLGTVNMPLDTRRAVYAEVRRSVHQAAKTGQPTRMEVVLPDTLVARFYHGWQMRRVWYYVIEPPVQSRPATGTAHEAQATSPADS